MVHVLHLKKKKIPPPPTPPFKVLFIPITNENITWASNAKQRHNSASPLHLSLRQHIDKSSWCSITHVLNSQKEQWQHRTLEKQTLSERLKRSVCHQNVNLPRAINMKLKPKSRVLCDKLSVHKLCLLPQRWENSEVRHFVLSPKARLHRPHILKWDCEWWAPLKACCIQILKGCARCHRPNPSQTKVTDQDKQVMGFKFKNKPTKKPNGKGLNKGLATCWAPVSQKYPKNLFLPNWFIYCLIPYLLDMQLTNF